MTCKKSAKELAGDEWTLGDINRLSTEEFWTWAKTDATEYDGHPYLANDKYVDFERELLFELGKCTWRNHWSVYQDHMKYVCNDTVKPFKVKILRYAEHVCETHDPEKYLPTPSMKGYSAIEANWSVCNEEFTTSDLRLTIKDRITKTIRDELDDHPEDYSSLTYEYWYELL